ncbi:MAG: MSMEG_0572/Sll0783 family nitrogen starvation response protein [Egibacteraceae bacterium]
MVDIVGERVQKGDAIVDYEDKVFEDIEAEEGESAYVFMHTVPFEGSVGLVNMLTTTRIRRKGFDTHLILYGPGSLMASATRGFPKVGDEAFPGAMAYNKQLQTLMDEGGHVYACRFSAAALYGMREVDMMEGVRPLGPLDILDAVLTARRSGALMLQTFTV